MDFRGFNVLRNPTERVLPWKVPRPGSLEDSDQLFVSIPRKTMDAFLEKLGVKKVGALAATFAAMKMTAVTAYTAGMLEPLNDLIEVRRCSHFHRSLKRVTWPDPLPN